MKKLAGRLFSQRGCFTTGPGSYYTVPEVESPKGLHDEEVGGEAVL